MELIYLPKLKHLLAGRVIESSLSSELCTVRMPRKTARSMEILRHVHVSRGEDLVERVGRLNWLRKLAVVLDDGGRDDNIKILLRTISKLNQSGSRRRHRRAWSGKA
ncbi:hypothetical protein E2562_032287 [Oryza meyeriana var. granulata]|uniref:Uncharacterized protein n=1 Tax=Oryza meyeriana var. granulata TaxID=110450 RepID=A0A6G1F0I7_9ORYZ|nr:hypothetical protein E2562_032287 [Oryza meyeriana var. granulata]